MKCNVVDMRNHRYFENPNCKFRDERRYVFEIPEDKLGVIAEGALVISLESFGFNGGSLAWYGEYMGEFVWNKDEERMELVGPHAEFDPHNGWTS